MFKIHNDKNIEIDHPIENVEEQFDKENIRNYAKIFIYF